MMMYNNNKNPCYAFLLISMLCCCFTQHGSSCRVLNVEHEEVTLDFVTFRDSANNIMDYAVVDCQGDHQCEQFVIENCDEILCKGREACTQANITNVGSIVTCEGEHSCHRTQISGRDSSKTAGEEDEEEETTPAEGESTATSTAEIETERTHVDTSNNDIVVQCYGDVACDVATIVGVDYLDCLGFQACRKVKARVPAIKCHGGEDESGDACMDKNHFHTECLYCGIFGCGYKCHAWIVDSIPNSNGEDDELQYKSCKIDDATILSENQTLCPPEWQNELDYEIEVAHGTETNEDGNR